MNNKANTHVKNQSSVTLCKDFDFLSFISRKKNPSAAAALQPKTKKQLLLGNSEMFQHEF